MRVRAVTRAAIVTRAVIVSRRQPCRAPHLGKGEDEGEDEGEVEGESGGEGEADIEVSGSPERNLTAGLSRYRCSLPSFQAPGLGCLSR